MHSLREASRVARGERKPARLAGGDELTALCGQVLGYVEGDVAKTARWFRLPSPLLGDISPRDMIRCGHPANLQRFVMALADNTVVAE